MIIWYKHTMTNLRRQTLISRILALVIALQFLVPVAATLAQPQDLPGGFVICTSTGLKMQAADGSLVAYDNKQGKDNAQGEKGSHGPCQFCLSGVCAPVASLPLASPLAVLSRGHAAIVPPKRVARAFYAHIPGQRKVRAPPVS